MTGAIFSDLGQASRFMALDWVQELFKQCLGYHPFPATLNLRPVTPEVARQLNLKSSEGVIVARVEENSAASEAGIQRGDIIREINRQKVRSAADYEKLTKDVKEGDRLTVLLQRGPMSLYVAFTVNKG